MIKDEMDKSVDDGKFNQEYWDKSTKVTGELRGLIGIAVENDRARMRRYYDVQPLTGCISGLRP
jgi:hypothetical protein